MTNTTESERFDLPSWRFRVTRLGPVESGEIEVKPLTLLCGPNNTGKTWVMYALYGFIKKPVSALMPDLASLKDVIDELNEKRTCVWSYKAWLENNSQELIDAINKHTQERLSKVFNSAKYFFEHAKVDWLIEAQELVSYGLKNELSIPGYIDQIGEGIVRITTAEDDGQFAGALFSHMLKLNLLGWPNARTVFLMPAERNGLHLFFRELTDRRAALLHPGTREQTLGGILGGSASLGLASYAEPIADYIDWLVVG